MIRVTENLSSIRDLLAKAAHEANRDPASIELLAVSKTHPLDSILEAAAAGQRDFGENYVQEGLEKIAACPRDDLVWHFIGHLQSNKTRMTAEHYDWVHTVDNLKIARRLGEQHPRVAATLVDYADVLTLSSDIPAVQDEAEELLCEALAIQRATYEADNMEIARTLDMLGHVSQQRQDVSAAVTLYEQALAIRQRLHGEEHPTVASSHRTIAWALIMAGQPTGAEEHARAALDIERATYGEHTVPVREGLTMLASALRMQHRYDEAEAVLREALATGGRSDASHAITLGALASVLREKGELVEAEQMQRETIAVLRRQNQTEPTLAFSLAKLADILHEQGREPEAEQVLIDGLDTLREAHGAEHPAVQYLVQQLEAF